MSADAGCCVDLSGSPCGIDCTCICDRNYGKPVFSSLSGVDDCSSGTPVCGFMAWESTSEPQRETVLKNRRWFAILDWIKNERKTQKKPVWV